LVEDLPQVKVERGEMRLPHRSGIRGGLEVFFLSLKDEAKAEKEGRLELPSVSTPNNLLFRLLKGTRNGYSKIFSITTTT
jgi:hypothetical protein